MTMATVTVIVTLRRIEGRTPVDLDALAEAVADELADLVDSTTIEAPDLDGEDLSYEISGVRLARTADVDVALLTEGTEESECEWCHSPIFNEAHGRARRYCSDAHRQAAYRARLG
jgi:hypothetical protein